MVPADSSPVPPPVNEPNLTYLPGSPECAELKAQLSVMASERLDIPLIVGGRGSGTNDKAGSKVNLLRWVSACTIQETSSPPRDCRYGYMGGA